MKHDGMIENQAGDCFNATISEAADTATNDFNAM
jgi:hypothetical protein